MLNISGCVISNIAQYVELPSTASIRTPISSPFSMSLLHTMSPTVQAI